MSARDGPGVMDQGSARLAARLGVIATMLLWGSQYPLMHDLARRWDPYTMILIRFAVAIVVLWGLEKLWWRGGRPGPNIALLRKALLGSAMATFAVLFTVGVAIGNPVTVAVVAAMAPAVASVVSWVVAKERPSSGVLLGLLCVIPGALIATVDPSAPEDFRPREVLGAAFLLLAQASWGWYSLMAQRWLYGYPQVAITGRSLRWAYPMLIVVYLIARASGETYAEWQTSPTFDAAIFVLLTLGALVAGTVFWNFGVARLGLSVTALHLNLIPIVAILVAAALGILPRVEQLTGAALVLVGVVIGQRSRSSLPRA